jgi:hypothetical protein
MKRLAAILLFNLSALAAPVPHAILSVELDAIIAFRDEDAGIINAMRAGSQSNEVSRIRLVVIPEQPAVTLQQEIREAGSNISDGGWLLTSSNVTKVWDVHNFTSQEILTRNTNHVNLVARELDKRVRLSQWEPGIFRLDALQSELLGLIVKIIIAENLQTNLTVPERARASTLTNELTKAYRLWKAAQPIRENILTNSTTIVDPADASLWPTNVVIGE